MKMFPTKEEKKTARKTRKLLFLGFKIVISTTIFGAVMALILSRFF